MTRYRLHVGRSDNLLVCQWWGWATWCGRELFEVCSDQDDPAAMFAYVYRRFWRALGAE